MDAAAATWVGIAAVVIALLAEGLRRRWRARDESRRALDAAILAWRAALDQRDPERAAFWARRIAHMKKSILLFCAGALVIAAAGCSTSAPPSPAVIVIGRHIRMPMPGDVVPELPDDETVWYLCTPTGLQTLLPPDIPTPLPTTTQPQP